MKQNWSKIAIALGPAIVMVSIAWEMARTNPAYNFLVEPWALNGYEMDQGWTYFAIGVVLLLVGLAVMPKRAVEVPYSAAVVAFATVAATVLALVYAPGTVSITFSGVIVGILVLVLTLMTYRTFKSLVLPRIPALDRFVARTFIALGILVVLFLVLSMTLGGSTIEAGSGITAFVAVGLLGLFALATAPHGLAANRMLIYASVLGGAVIGMSGGSLRTTLLEAQVATVGVSGQYKDVQVGMGWFIALVGIMILFVGAVALWATRRDLIIARSRAREQRAAAEKSAKEIRESYEQYEREKAAAAAPA
ncbi:MAG: hypothetical protein U9N78_08260, partial [Actinomycetota bacterium]|nr:hypothetical protein [Actinomycetota bacterium]